MGNFSASTGKAKAKKTFNVSALVAASLANGKVLNYRANLPEGKRKILYVDTEQSRYHCHNVLERILKLAGLPTNINNETLDFICLREYTPSVRIEVIYYALAKTKAMDWSSSTESGTCFSTSTMRENRSRSSTR